MLLKLSLPISIRNNWVIYFFWFLYLHNDFLIKKDQPFPKQICAVKCMLYCLENTVEKEEIAHKEQILLFQQGFLPLWKNATIFIKFKMVICKLF